MTMAHGERMLRESGDPRDLVYADMFAAILASRGHDVPLPGEVQTAPSPVAAAAGRQRP